MKKTIIFQLVGSLTMLMFSCIFPTYAIQIGIATIIGYQLEILYNQSK